MEESTTGNTSTSLPVPRSRAGGRSNSRVQPREHGQGAHQTPLPPPSPKGGEGRCHADPRTEAPRWAKGQRHGRQPGRDGGAGPHATPSHTHHAACCSQRSLIRERGGTPTLLCSTPRGLLGGGKDRFQTLREVGQARVAGQALPSDVPSALTRGLFCLSIREKAFLPPSEGQRRPR